MYGRNISLAAETKKPSGRVKLQSFASVTVQSLSWTVKNLRKTAFLISKFTVFYFSSRAKNEENDDRVCIFRCFVILRLFGYMVESTAEIEVQTIGLFNN